MLPCTTGSRSIDGYLRLDDGLTPSNAEPAGFRCEVAAWTVLRLGLPELAALRQHPESRFPAQITPQFLKNSDDQTIATLAGIFDCMSSINSPPADYREWGVVAASRNVGRGAFAATLHKYGKDGPWGVSVQVVPHHLLHSVSSTISLALPCQGPCLGAGGGLNGEVDALLAASNLLADQGRAGVWVTWSYWDPELVIDATGKPTCEAHCVVGALALRPLIYQSAATQLAIRAPRHLEHSSQISSRPASSNLTSSLLDVARLRPKNFAVVCQLSGGLEVEISGRYSRPEATEQALHVGRQSLAVPNAM